AAARAAGAGKGGALVVGAGVIGGGPRLPQLRVLAESFSRDGVRQSLGADEYPGATLLARTEWLQAHADSARRLARAIVRSLQFIQSHEAAEILEQLPAIYRTDPATDLATMRAFTPLFSIDGRMVAGTADTVRRVLAISLEDVRGASIDLQRTYTNTLLPTP